MNDNIQNIMNLNNLLHYDARKFTSAEILLKNSLPGWITLASSIKLKTVLQKYLDFVQNHIHKMESFYEEEQILPIGLSNSVMQAFIAEADEKVSYCNDPAIKDACLLASIQAINHFKISNYGTAAAFANTLGLQNHATFFHEAEVNEKQVDDRLSQLAEFEINRKASSPKELSD